MNILCLEVSNFHNQTINNGCVCGISLMKWLSQIDMFRQKCSSSKFVSLTPDKHGQQKNFFGRSEKKLQVFSFQVDLPDRFYIDRLFDPRYRKIKKFFPISQKSLETKIVSLEQIKTDVNGRKKISLSEKLEFHQKKLFLAIGKQKEAIIHLKTCKQYSIVWVWAEVVGGVEDPHVLR